MPMKIKYINTYTQNLTNILATYREIFFDIMSDCFSLGSDAVRVEIFENVEEFFIVNIPGNPGVKFSDPYPYPSKPLPA
jgi:hypothetical protein